MGKSLLVTALCRYYRQLGFSVAPFKALNMALNAHVTAEGFEIARAQAVQAEACGIAPCVEMNPLLLKPESNQRSQVILLGRPSGSRSARELFATGLDVRGAVLDALATMRSRHDLVIIEGAGSPAEINLRARDVANMFTARAADAPVLLAGDIDRGGVFAAFVGTLALLEPEDRARVKGFLVNKFRGDVSLLTPGLDWLRDETGIPVLGVLPHLGGLKIAEEDSLNVDARTGKGGAGRPGRITIAVLRLPRISNHDEFQPLEHEADVELAFTTDPAVAMAADLLIVPGTKSTVSDLAWLREEGFDHLIRLRAQRNMPVLGICGGCQMLGTHIADPDHVESEVSESAGIGLLPLTTRFTPRKHTVQVRARSAGSGFLFAGLASTVEVPGYFIHAGLTRAEGPPAHELHGEHGWSASGATNESGAVVGTMVHGLLEHDGLRHALLDGIRQKRGLGSASHKGSWDREAEYDRLAATIAEHCDAVALRALIGA